jgi:hypothetical protein
MKKGRLYAEVLRYLSSQKDIEIKKGIDVFDIVEQSAA